MTAWQRYAETWKQLIAAARRLRESLTDGRNADA